MTVLFFKENVGFPFACSEFILEVELSFSHEKRTDTSGTFKRVCFSVCFCHISKCLVSHESLTNFPGMLRRKASVKNKIKVVKGPALG